MEEAATELPPEPTAEPAEPTEAAASSASNLLESLSRQRNVHPLKTNN